MSREPAILPVRLGNLELHVVMDTGFFDVSAFSPATHCHPCWELFAPLRGRFRIETLPDGGVEPVPGTLCLVPPLVYHNTADTARDGVPAEKLSVRFSYRRAGGPAGLYERLEQALAAIAGPYFLPDAEELTALLAQVRRELLSCLLGRDAAAQALLTCVFVGLLRRLCPAPAAPAPGPESDAGTMRYFTAELWFGREFARPVTEDDLAAALNLSRRQLSRTLRALYGMSFREKLADVRVHQAAKLLARTDDSVEEIAAAVGYGSPSGLYRAFVRCFGLSMGDYRRRCRQRKGELPR